MKSVTARVVALALAVALASAGITGYALARAAGVTDRERAAFTLQQTAKALALAQARPRARQAVPDLAQALRTELGVESVVVPIRGTAPLPDPFRADDLAVVRAIGALRDTRSGGGRTWLVAGRRAGSEAVLLAQPLDRAVSLTSAQKGRLVIGLAIGLFGGALAGVALGRGLTRPLARVAAAARRLSAGQRDVRVPPEGPLEVADVAQALNGLAHALAASEERQRAFLLNVSHELRTPLTAVSGYAEALADSALPPEEIPRAGLVIRDEAARLQRRVEDLLALARLEADDFRIEPAPVDIGVLLRAAADAWAPRAQEAGVSLTVQAPPTGPVAQADGERVRQIVDALVDNALRVLPPGAPLVLAAWADERGVVCLAVRDGGPGLTADDLAVAFQRGRLQERYRGSRAVGSGLGLALVGELAHRMGGTAEATPAPEGGACFAVWLPRGG